MAPAEAPEKVAEVEFFNDKEVGLNILVKRDPQVHANPLVAQDKFATFVNGRLKTSDPDVIAWCRSEQGRARGCREFGNADDIAYLHGIDMGTDEGRKHMDALVEARAEERALEILAERQHKKGPTKGTAAGAEPAESVPPGE